MDVGEKDKKSDQRRSRKNCLECHRGARIWINDICELKSPKGAAD